MDREVKELLACYNLSEHFDAVKDWYDGYRFGNVDIYCPWDVVNYCAALRADVNALPCAYWLNTSGNRYSPAYFATLFSPNPIRIK